MKRLRTGVHIIAFIVNTLVEISNIIYFFNQLRVFWHLGFLLCWRSRVSEVLVVNYLGCVDEGLGGIKEPA